MLIRSNLASIPPFNNSCVTLDVPPNTDSYGEDDLFDDEEPWGCKEQTLK